jgi:hypothetical protein
MLQSHSVRSLTLRSCIYAVDVAHGPAESTQGVKCSCSLVCSYAPAFDTAKARSVSKRDPGFASASFSSINKLFFRVEDKPVHAAHLFKLSQSSSYARPAYEALLQAG